MEGVGVRIESAGGDDHAVGGDAVDVEPGIAARVADQHLGTRRRIEVAVAAPALPGGVPVEVLGAEAGDERVIADDPWLQHVLGTLLAPAAAREPVGPELAEGQQHTAVIEEARELIATCEQRVTVGRARHDEQVVAVQVGLRQVAEIEHLKPRQRPARLEHAVVVGDSP